MESRYRGSKARDYLPEVFPDSSKTKRRQRTQDDWVSLAILFVFVSAVFSVNYYFDHWLPTPLTTRDSASKPHSFIEERARNDLKVLTSNGPRVCGSHENDVLAVHGIITLLEDVKRTAMGIHSMEIEIQKPTGAFNMLFQDGYTSSYADVPNIIVKLSPKAKSKHTGRSVLVNCHFDSVPGSPGASDNMISCVNMIEVLRVLTRQLEPLKNDIIFLFNGAEENVLQGSHGFVAGRDLNNNASSQAASGHRWSHNIKAFINLEAAGAGGREILFQTGPGNGWLLDVYAQVPYPYGSVVGEEIFQKNLIPSDTDFRIFRDFAHIPGLDFAFIKNGYAYHTKLDNIDSITPGSIQREGANLLVLVKILGNLDFNGIVNSKESMVFFDMWGVFLVHYSENVALILNLIVGVGTLYIVWLESDKDVRKMFFYVFYSLGAWVTGILSAVILALILNTFGIYSPFHSHPYMVFILFGVPALVGQLEFFSYHMKRNEDEVWMALKTTLAVLLIVMTFFSRMVFMLMLNLAFGITGWYISRSVSKKARPKMICYLLIGETIPLSVSFYLVAACIDVFVPIMGRSGSETNPNVFVAVLTSFTLSVPAFTGIVPILLFLKKPYYKMVAVKMILLALWIVVFVGKIPYTPKTPMRMHILDVHRVISSKTDLDTVTSFDHGYWLFNIDPNIPRYVNHFKEGIATLENHDEIDVSTCEELNCGLPFILPVRNLIRKTLWIPQPTKISREKITHEPRMTVVEDNFVTQSVRRVTLRFHGPSHMTIVFSPDINHKLVKSSLTQDVPSPSGKLWKDRPVYFIYRARGIKNSDFELSLDFERTHVPEGGAASPWLDVVFSSFYLHGDDMKTSELKMFCNEFPNWVYTIGWSATSKLYYFN